MSCCTPPYYYCITFRVIEADLDFKFDNEPLTVGEFIFYRNSHTPPQEINSLKSFGAFTGMGAITDISILDRTNYDV